jgi:hypothetical protein
MANTYLARKILKVLLVLVMSVPSVSFAVDCSRPPTGFGGSWARQYKDWCESCCGKYYPSGPRCDPGSNWGCRQQGGSGSGGSSYDYEAERQRQLEAERQRQRELEEQRRREEEEAKLRQEEFQKNKQEALGQMKGIGENELGLKGIGDTGTGGLELKDIGDTTQPKKPDCEWGNMGSSVVDLRCLGLDPNKPISVDPNVVKGKERVFPAQIDPATFKNTNYNKGFEALMRFDAASAAAAVEYFKQAQKERPKDPLVRNALLLAQDILRARQKKEANDKARAAYFTLQSYASMMMGDNENAKGYIAQARKLDPNDNNTKFVESLAKLDLGAEGTYPGRRDAYRFVANSLVSISKQNIAVAVSMLEAAQRLQPLDQFIGMFLQELRNYEAGSASANTGK